jgi:hypothetical protein
LVAIEGTSTHIGEQDFWRGGAPSHLLVPMASRLCVLGKCCAGRGRAAEMPSGCCSCEQDNGLRICVEPPTGVVERAFEIARSGDVESITLLRQILIKEGYSNVAQVLAGRSLKLQLTRMITEATMTRPRRPL